jgi:hypothetical protein
MIGNGHVGQDFLGLEFVTALYSKIPGHTHFFIYLYTGLNPLHIIAVIVA